MGDKFTHFDEKGNAIMVDVTEKAETHRTAVAKGFIKVSKEVMEAVVSGNASKGDVLGVSRVAGIMGAKKTSDLIPMCHPLMISKCAIEFETDEDELKIWSICTVKTKGITGVEMEALTGVSTSLLTIYDMCKAMDKAMTIGEIHLVEKIGGKSGHFVNRKTSEE